MTYKYVMYNQLAKYSVNLGLYSTQSTSYTTPVQHTTHDVDARGGLCAVSVGKGAPFHQHATGGYDAQTLTVVSVNQTVSDLDVVCPENKDTIASRLSDMQLHNT